MYQSVRQICQNIFIAAVIFTTSVVTPANAAFTNPATPKITFTFDDGRASTIKNAAPILAKYGLSGTAYITTGCVGMTTVPNTCHAAQDVPYMSWSQVKNLQNTYGWEIGSHSKTHPYMASSNAHDDQPHELTNSQVVRELVDSKADLAAHGINVTSYASPYGDYDPYVLKELAKVYSSHRGFADQNDNVWPYNDILLNNMQVQAPVTTAAVKAKIDYAIAHKTWLVLTLHDVVAKPSTNTNKYQWGTSQLESVAAYVKAKRDARAISAVNASGGLATGVANLLPGADFTSGISNGWRTDRPGVFSADGARNGSLPGPAKSIRISANTLAGNAHLFSPRISVNPNKLYLLKNYLNVQSITNGEVGFYIDEFDGAGSWVSGQFKGREAEVFAQSFNFSYTPTSSAVTHASLQIYSTGPSNATGFLDSVRWYEAATGSTAPQTNMMLGGTFDEPWTTGWSTDNSAAITRDSGSHGSPSNPVNSILANSTSGTAHLFSPRIGVDATKSYLLENYLDITSNTTGEIGFYIDEYDTAGNWVSGQYKYTQRALGKTEVRINYAPGSSAVTHARLQVIFTAGTGQSAYLDDSRWRQL